MLAAIQAQVIMMSENRQTAKDRNGHCLALQKSTNPYRCIAVS